MKIIKHCKSKKQNIFFSLFTLLVTPISSSVIFCGHSVSSGNSINTGPGTPSWATRNALCTQKKPQKHDVHNFINMHSVYVKESNHAPVADSICIFQFAHQHFLWWILLKIIFFSLRSNGRDNLTQALDADHKLAMRLFMKQHRRIREVVSHMNIFDQKKRGGSEKNFQHTFINANWSMSCKDPRPRSNILVHPANTTTGLCAICAFLTAVMVLVRPGAESISIIIFTVQTQKKKKINQI